MSTLRTLLQTAYQWQSDALGPYLTKPAIDAMIVSTISYNTYYAATSHIGGGFMTKAVLAMGYKVFTAIAEPATAQFVETYTEMHVNHAKFVYHSIGCVFIQHHCDQIPHDHNPFINRELSPNLINDFVQFDTARYQQEIEKTVAPLTTNSLLSSGLLSATASEIRSFAFDVSGFTPHCQNYLCKQWISPYVKDFIKLGLKEIFADSFSHPTVAIKSDIKSEPAVTPQAITPTVQLHEVLYDAPAGPAPCKNVAPQAECIAHQFSNVMAELKSLHVEVAAAALA